MVEIVYGVGGGGEVIEVGGWTRVAAAVGHTSVDEKEGGCLRAAVELSFYLLRVGVWSQLLAAALHLQEKAIVLRV